MLSKDGILKFRIVYSMFLFDFALVLGGVLWAYFSLRNASGPVVIHFNDIAGINRIGSFWDVVGIGVTGLAIVVLNLFIALEFEKRDRFWGKLAAAFTVVVSILIFIALAAIISVN